MRSVTIGLRERRWAVDGLDEDYPWVGTRDDRFTLALILDVPLHDRVQLRPG